MQHQARFRQAGVQPLAAFGLRDQGSDPFRTSPQEAGAYRQAGMLASQLPGRHLQQGDLTAVGVEQHQALKAGLRQLTGHRHHQLNQGVGREAQGSGEAQMLR
jgi:hypothetical protein